ncbi:MAG: hypothetical protein H6565_08130 [Lewinellaceae bacterium]|nr:hypothetical protein [Lewinellaceae bacterium]
MKKTRFILSLITMLCLAGWAWLRKPYSPSQELEPIVLTAFDIHADRPAGGYALAEAAAGWRGVTASSYNPASGLLALAHTSSVTPRDLTSRLKVLTPRPVSIKSFPEPAGTSCPVPAAALATLPGWLLGAGIFSAASLALLALGRPGKPVWQ